MSQIIYTFPKNLVLAFLLLISYADVVQAGSIALVIGNAQYQNEKPLRNPVNDAALIAHTLKHELGFDEVIEHSNLTRRGLVDAVNALASRAQGNDRIVVYYSGHGMQGPGGNYLIPIDARITEAAHVKGEGIAVSDLTEILGASGANVALLILDACRDSPYSLRTKSASKGLARMPVSSGNLLVAYATQEGETADDGIGQNSPYALALASALKRKELRVLEIFDEVATEVKLKTGKQRPTRYGDLAVNVYLVPRPIVAATIMPVDSEAVYWSEVKQAERSEFFEAYLAQYPEGKFKSEAQFEMKRLAEPAKTGQPTQPVGTVFKDCENCPSLVVVPGMFDGVPFAVGQSEVTQAQWKAVMGNNPSKYVDCGVNCPVEQVSFNDAMEYVKRLNQETGKSYRLPSEKEWLHACKAGQDTKFCGGNDATEVGWVIGFWPSMGTKPVKQKRANQYGLFDLTGNVEEWTSTCWSGDCNQRVIRGASWYDDAGRAGIGKREPVALTARAQWRGLRVVRTF